jgi:hypothetical protein
MQRGAGKFKITTEAQSKSKSEIFNAATDIRGTEQKLEEHALRQAIIFACAALGNQQELSLKRVGARHTCGG